MMKTQNLAKLLSIAAVICLTGNVASADSGANGWQAQLMVKVVNADSRLIFGRNIKATDGVDRRFDVPPMLGGTLTAVFTNGGGSLWKDIRLLDDKGRTWVLDISSSANGAIVTITWNPVTLPAGVSLTLTDDVSGMAVDMKASDKYSFINDRKRSLTIEAR